MKTKEQLNTEIEFFATQMKEFGAKYTEAKHGKELARRELRKIEAEERRRKNSGEISALRMRLDGEYNLEMNSQFDKAFKIAWEKGVFAWNR